MIKVDFQEPFSTFMQRPASQRALLFNSLSLAAIQEIHSTKTSFYYVSQGHCPNLEVLEKQLLPCSSAWLNSLVLPAK